MDSGTLFSRVVDSDIGGCPKGMIAVTAIPGIQCVDAYEVAPSDDCPHLEPSNSQQTNENFSESSCTSESREGVIPWRFISRDQAMQMCARTGKRLPSSEEWYMLSLGMVPNESICNTAS